MAFWARTTKDLRRPGDIEHALSHLALLELTHGKKYQNSAPRSFIKNQ